MKTYCKNCKVEISYHISAQHPPNYCKQCKAEFAEKRKGGTLYDSSMGNVKGGSVTFNRDGSRKHTVYDSGSRVSWTENKDGTLKKGDPHFTDQGANKKDTKGRHPFGK